MGLRAAFAVGVLGICGVVAAASRADAQNAPSTPSPFGPAPSKPPLFGPRAPLNELREQLARQAAEMRLQAGKPKVVCGMTVIPVQPNADPRSIKKAPDDRKYTMRSVRPQMCADPAQSPDVSPAPELPKPDVQPEQPQPAR